MPQEDINTAVEITRMMQIKFASGTNLPAPVRRVAADCARKLSSDMANIIAANANLFAEELDAYPTGDKVLAIDDAIVLSTMATLLSVFLQRPEETLSSYMKLAATYLGGAERLGEIVNDAYKDAKQAGIFDALSTNPNEVRANIVELCRTRLEVADLEDSNAPLSN
jgi:hypothetical protein